jgi:hypothetical protein
MLMRCHLASLAGMLLAASTISAQSTLPAWRSRVPVECRTTDHKLPQPPDETAAQADAIIRQSRTQPGVIAADEPENFGIERYTVAAYANCIDENHCYWTDVKHQTDRAQAELTRLLAAHHATTPAEAKRQHLAIVLDIDETSLSSYCEEKREDYGYIGSMFDVWVISPEASLPIPGTLALSNQAVQAGVAVFFVTGRPGRGTAKDQTDATARNLATAGYHDWTELILHDATYTTPDTTRYKSLARAHIQGEGYTILLNMGDQWSDLNEPADWRSDHAATSRGEVSVKLPNPFYFLP